MSKQHIKICKQCGTVTTIDAIQLQRKTLAPEDCWVYYDDGILGHTDGYWLCPQCRKITKHV